MVANPTNLIRVMPAEGLRMPHNALRPFFHRIASAVSAATVGALLLAAPAQAQDKPVLTVLTYSSFVGKYGPGARIKERFEQVCACTVSWITSDDAGAMLSRLKLEGESSKADVVLGLDAGMAGDAAATGLFAPHGRALGGLALPIGWTDPLFVPFDWGYLAFVYDADKLKTPPASLKALVEDAGGPRIIVQDPRTSAPGFGFMLWMKDIYGDQAPTAWKALRPRIVTFTKGWSEAYGLFLKGEADMVLSYTSSPAYHIAVEKKTNYKAAAFTEGNYLQIEIAGVTKASKRAALASSFLDFMLSEPFQGLMAEGNWMYPAKTPAAGLPASYADLAKPAKGLLIDPARVAENRRAWIDEWLSATAR